MKTKKEIRAIYKKLLKKYFYVFLERNTSKTPINCAFNIQQPFDDQKLLEDGDPNPNYNKKNQDALLWYDSCILDEDDATFMINDIPLILPLNIVNGDISFTGGYFKIALKDAVKYGLEDHFTYLGLCKITLDKDEIKICDHMGDAKRCPAFTVRYSRNEIETMFWEYAKVHLNDLIVLKEIINGSKVLPFWYRVKGFFTFKK